MFLLLFLFNLAKLDFALLDKYIAFNSFSSFKNSLSTLGFAFDKNLPVKIFLTKKNSFSFKLLAQKEYILPFIIPKNYQFGITEEKPIPKEISLPKNFLVIESIGKIRGEEVLKVFYYPFLIKENRLIFYPAIFEYEEPEIKLLSLTSLDTLRNEFEKGYFIFKIYIDSSGLYKITGKELKDKGLPLNLVKQENLQLFSIGDYETNRFYPDTMREVPIIVVSRDKKKFSEKDYILFYARGASSHQNLYTLYNIYWLFVSDKKGKRIKEISSLPTDILQCKNFGKEKKHFELDKDCPARGGLLWIWDKIEKSRAEDSKEKGYSFNIEGLIKLLNIKLRIFTDNHFDFILKLFINDQLFDTTKVINASPPSGYTYNKHKPFEVKDKFSLKLSFYKKDGPFNFYTDYFSFTFLRRLDFKTSPFFIILDTIKRWHLKISSPKEAIILDITDEFQPKLLKNYLIKKDTLYLAYYAFFPTILYITDLKKAKKARKIENKTYYKTSNIHALNADYFIIVPDELYYITRNLKRMREREIRAAVVKISEIFDHYLFGIEEPYALKKFFSLKRPMYGVLIGDATYDYRGLVYKKPQILTYEVGYGFDFEVDNTFIYALDSYFADFEGEGGSPDFVLSRLSLRNEKEVRDYLKKIEEYEKNLTAYKKRFLLLADDEYKGSPEEPDVFRDEHIRNCENIARLIPKDYDIYKIYLTEFPFLGEEDKTNARDEFLKVLQKGIGFAFYFGHGAGFQIAHEKLLTLEDVLKIKARPNYPIAYFGSCGVGRFDDTRFEALCEELIRNKEGFIGTIGAIKGTSPSPNEELLRRFLRALIINNENILGSAFFNAWSVNTFYHLFAEPLIKINLPRRREVFCEIETPFLPGKRSEFRINFLNNVSLTEILFNLGKKKRRYKSRFIDISYELPGEEVFRSRNILRDSFYSFSFTFPKGIGLDTVFLGSPENYYWENPKSLKLSIFYLIKDSCFTFNLDTLQRDTLPYYNFDTLPPKIELFAFNKMLKDTNEVPKNFILEIKIFDENQIFLIKKMPYSPKIFLNDEIIDLSDYLIFSNSLYYCKIPISLKEEFNLLKVVVYDNLLNRSEKKVILKTKRVPKIEIRDIKVARMEKFLYFTFKVNERCIGGVKIYTISGRKVRERENLIFDVGFNLLPIEIFNLPRGVYLYKLYLSSIERKDKKEIINKLIIDY